jgi:hypothetical protein
VVKQKRVAAKGLLIKMKIRGQFNPDGLWVYKLRPVPHSGGYKLWFEEIQGKFCLCCGDGVQARFATREAAVYMFSKIKWRAS